MAKIFISYNRSSETIVKSLADDIEMLGHAVWFDQALTGGRAWWDQILAEVRDCSIFVFVLSPEGLNSTACKREYTYASQLGKPVLPVLVAEGVSINLLPPALSKIEFIDYRKQDRDAAFRLARALSTAPPAGPLPDPLPEPPDTPISYFGGLAEQIDSATTLSYPEQTALLVDLKRSLRDSESIADSRTLLKKFRKRRDLFATIAEDIDEVLRSPEEPIPTEVSPKPDPELDPDPGPHLVRPGPRNVNESATFLHSIGSPGDATRLPVDHASPESKAPEADAEELAVMKKDMSYGLARKAMLKGAWIGAAAGFICGILFLLTPAIGRTVMIPFPIAGAIAGAINGTNRKGMFVGMIVAVLCDLFVAFAYPVYSHIGDGRFVVPLSGFLITLMAPPLGALVALRNSRKKQEEQHFPFRLGSG